MLSTPMPRSQGRSSLVSRNVTVAGHRTSVRLEPDMWAALSDICKRERTTIHEVCTAVAERKGEGSSLTAAIRVFIMAYFRAAATDQGHVIAGHGAGMPFRIEATMANGGLVRK
ncbi:MAG: hypothetical protein GC131_06595 [Alphaproteobacteria bacterium]|nr:hypothetical protein [Alphaproteobacteria bacterium]